MSDIKQYEPLWGAWRVGSLIGRGSYGKVYKVSRQDFGKTYDSAVKIISIPQDEDEIRQMRNAGFGDASMRTFYKSLVTGIINEVELMSDFRGNSNIVSYEDHQITERTDRVGWDILLRMELLTSLSESAAEKPLSTAETIKLGLHICRALELCAQKNTIHRDIKPDNIFVSQYGDYKLGDFGIARQIEHTMSELSKKGTYSHMAPEIFHGTSYDSSVDTYSLGIVLYRFLNQNRLPFLPEYPESILPHHLEKAMQRRMGGESIPAIKGIGPQFNALLQKACAYDRAERFTSPAQMRESLEETAKAMGYVLGGAAIVHSIPNPKAPSPEVEETTPLEYTLVLPSTNEHESVNEAMSAPTPAIQPAHAENKRKIPDKSKIPLIAAICSLAALSIVLAVILALGLTLGGSNLTDPPAGSASLPHQAPGPESGPDQPGQSSTPETEPDSPSSPAQTEPSGPPSNSEPQLPSHPPPDPVIPPSEPANKSFAGEYRIKNVSGKMLNAFALEGQAIPGTKVTTSNRDSSPEQKFRIEVCGVINNENQYRIVSLSNAQGYCIDIFGDKSAVKSGSAIHIYYPSSSGTNIWYIKHAGDNSYIICSSLDDTLVLAAAEDKHRADVIVQTYTGSYLQKWTIDPID